jgi:hypothetical protein
MTRKDAWFGRVYAVAFVAAGITLIAGAYLIHQPARGVQTAGAALLGAGCLGIIGMLASIPIALNIRASGAEAAKRQAALMTALGERLEGLSILLNLVSEQQLLSDRAKQVAFREKDREAVRRAVQEEMSRRDWEAAFVLANDIENSFGYKQEADRLRGEINGRRDEIQRQQLAELMAPIDRHIKAELWGAALQEAQDLMRQFPGETQVQRLPEEIENRRQMRKGQLRESWQEAVDRHDVDGSIEILKKLDLYLTPAEAESMQEIARNVFKEKREGLRSRFALAVQEHKWAEAIRLGDEIIHDFPNTRIAQEVREKMEALRQRADEPHATSA